MDTNTFLGLIFSIIMGFIAAHFAAKRGRNPYAWLAIGILFGILGVLALFVMPPIKKEGEESIPTSPNAIPIEEIPAKPIQLITLKEWFCIDKEKKQHGPISFEGLRDLWQKGLVVPGSYVWSEGMGNWLPISGLPELQEALGM